MDSNLSIVLVEDNDDLRELTCDALRTQGHRVVGLSCAEELQDLARGAQADVFLIDINLPGEDGLGLARRIRQVQPLVGIIIISARTDLSDKVVGYDSGADWYLSKPVHFEELAAALKSFARRRQAQRADDTPPAGTLRLQQLELQGPAGCVVLTTAFARAPAGLMEHWQLAELLDIDMKDFNKSALEVRIFRLRKKLLESGAQGSVLESVRSVGYQLHVPVQIFA